MGEARVSVLCNISCQLGEGPTYDPVTDTLFWFDIIGRKLLERKLGDATTRVRDLPEMTSALAVINDGHQLLMTETGLNIRDVASGAITSYMAIEADNALTRSNDSRVHPCGAFWVSTMGRKHEAKAGSIYWFFKGEVRILFEGLTIPNSICFSPDGSIAYYVDTDEKLLMRVSCDPATGLPDGEPSVFYDHRGGDGGIDGSIVDADGNLWNARWGAGSLDAYSPEGKRLRSIALPARQGSCPAFIGADAGRIAVTSAWQDLDEAARDADPEAGQTFVVDLAVNGRHEPRVLI